MKFIVLFCTLILIFERVNCQSSTADTNNVTEFTSLPTKEVTSTTAEEITETTGSGDEEMDTTTTTAEEVTTTVDNTPCEPSPCLHDGICDITGNGQFICACKDGWMGETCSSSSSCEATTREIWTNETNQVCDNSTTSDSTAQNVTFGKVLIGHSSASFDYACGNKCELGGQPSAALRCVNDGLGGAVFEEDPQTIDCSKSYSELGTSEQAQLLSITTTDTSNITADQVSTTVDQISNLSKTEDMPPETSNDVISVINNLLQVTNNDAVTAVQAQSASILSSVTNVGTNVILDAAGEYFESQSDVALGVAQINGATRKKRAIDSKFYGTSLSLSSNLASSDFVLSADEPKGSYLQAFSCDPGRAQFQVYKSESELFAVDSLSAKLLTTVFYANCPGSSSSYTFKFQTDGSKDLTTISKSGDLGGTGYRVVKWEGSKWTGIDCTDFVGSGDFLTCTCKEGGPLSLRTVTIDDGLSGGAIAGIVIGCVAGVAIIGGLIYYLVQRNKKKKAKKVKPIDHASEHGDAHRNNAYESD